MATYLAVQCHDREDNTDKSADRSNHRAISQDTLASFLTDKATIVNERLSRMENIKAPCGAVTGVLRYGRDSTRDLAPTKSCDDANIQTF